MAPPVAVLDACVLYPAPLRDFLLHLACGGLFLARWTEEIHEEWTRNLLLNRPDLSPQQLERTRRLMNRAVPDGVVSGYARLIPLLTLPDPDDRHVLAAAIQASATVIVTFNGKHFPAAALAEFGIKRQHPDEFVCSLMARDADGVCKAARNQRATLKNPPRSVAEFLRTLAEMGLPETVSRLKRFGDTL